MRSWGMEPGLLYDRDAIEYSGAYRVAHAAIVGSPVAEARPVPVGFAHSLDRPMSLVVAGSAGGKVRSASRIVALGGIRSGLWAAQRDDYPVTVKSGHSVSELWIAPEEMPRTATGKILHRVLRDRYGEDSTEKGKLAVQSSFRDDCVEVRISDTGTGIPDEIRRRVFDPFFTTKGVGKGTGQGLAIARSAIVDKLGGELSFETEIGTGTTFIIRLPILEEDAVDEAA